MKLLTVLGNRMSDDGQLSDIMVARLQKTLEVQDGYDLILLSGGVANKKAGKAESDEMEKYLLARGVAADKLLKENLSRTTKQNAQFAKDIFKRLDVKDITLLSSAYHIERSWLNPVKLFQKYANVKVSDTIKA